MTFWYFSLNYRSIDQHELNNKFNFHLDFSQVHFKASRIEANNNKIKISFSVWVFLWHIHVLSHPPGNTADLYITRPLRNCTEISCAELQCDSRQSSALRSASLHRWRWQLLIRVPTQADGGGNGGVLLTHQVTTRACKNGSKQKQKKKKSLEIFKPEQHPQWYPKNDVGRRDLSLQDRMLTFMRCAALNQSAWWEDESRAKVIAIRWDKGGF